MQARGFDFSHWQRDVDAAAVGREFDFVGLKATEGTGFVDPAYRARRATLLPLLRSGGLSCLISYHFLSVAPAQAQVDHFLRTVGTVNEGELLALDLEQRGVSMGLAGRCARLVRERTGRWPLCYTGLWFVGNGRDADLARCDLWLADYSPSITLPANWPTWRFWQTTDRGRALGQSLDLDWFNGTAAELAAYARGKDGAAPRTARRPSTASRCSKAGCCG